jgi:protein required for attachment to host cells
MARAFLLLRNGDDPRYPSLAVADEPELDPTNFDQGKLRHSITTNQHTGNDLAEAAHVAAAAEWLNHRVLTNKIEQLIVVADKRSLGELRRHWHKEAQQRIVGEVAKALTGRPIPEIEAAIEAA